MEAFQSGKNYDKIRFVLEVSGKFGLAKIERLIEICRAVNKALSCHKQLDTPHGASLEEKRQVV